MKLLLTSGGLVNDAITSALKELTGRPFNQLKLAFIPTASNLEDGDKSWMIDDLKKCQDLGFAQIDIVDISALPQKIWKKRLEEAGVIFVGGGNTYHLMYWVNKSGLAEILPELLKSRVYIGLSAGSIIAGSFIGLVPEEKVAAEAIGETADNKALGFVDFQFEPHINSPYFPKLTFDYAKKISDKTKIPLYALDDNSAIQVVDDKIKVVSSGKWQKFD